ncbi:helix-turn-helix transcriptional regulator [Providencia rettgeri]
MKSAEINFLIDECHIFDGKNLNSKQREVVARFVFGQTVEEIAEIFNLTPRSVRRYLEEARHQFGESSSSGLRAIIFMKIIAKICC